jgi:hypothetical protein
VNLWVSSRGNGAFMGQVRIVHHCPQQSGSEVSEFETRRGGSHVGHWPHGASVRRPAHVAKHRDTSLLNQLQTRTTQCADGNVAC